VKTTELGLTTNLDIYTNRHAYHLNLESRRGFMRSVKFYYPHEPIEAVKPATTSGTNGVAGEARPGGVAPSPPPGARMDHAYLVSGPDVRWNPVQAFDDGAHVFIQMPPSMRADEAPALMLGDGRGKTKLVNYRVSGSYYLVDKLFERAVLVSGVGREQEQVSISYEGKAR
jgi:P-type conjugative transfer protein TrbG